MQPWGSWRPFTPHNTTTHTHTGTYKFTHTQQRPQELMELPAGEVVEEGESEEKGTKGS